jgi:hypothetical protein
MFTCSSKESPRSKWSGVQNKKLIFMSAGHNIPFSLDARGLVVNKKQDTTQRKCERLRFAPVKGGTVVTAPQPTTNNIIHKRHTITTTTPDFYVLCGFNILT